MFSSPYGEGQTRAKFILIGEHAVVHSRPAIAVPLHSLGLTARVETTPGNFNLVSDYYNGPILAAPEKLANIKTAILATLDYLAKPAADLSVYVDSVIPPERGLGSSAASAGAISHAIADLYNYSLNADEHYELVQQAEKVAHGNPSGLDARATNSWNPIWFQNGITSELALRLSGTFIIADTGIRGRTRLAVSDVYNYLDAKPRLGEKLLNRIEELTIQVATDLSDDRPEQLGERMDEAQRILKELTVSSVEIDNLVTTAKNAGALGAKLTGGGQGGCVVVLTRDVAEAADVSERLIQSGAKQTWLFEARAHTI